MSNTSGSASGGVRNLRAMFEQSDSSPPLLPNPGQSARLHNGSSPSGLFRPGISLSSSKNVSASSVVKKSSPIAPSTDFVGPIPPPKDKDLKGKGLKEEDPKEKDPKDKKCEPKSDNSMARNPYAGLSASSDAYSNANAKSSGALNAASAGDDYDPYGDRYGTPPISISSSSRERRAGRSDGYGGFYDDSNGSKPAVQPATQPQDRFDGYGRRSEEEVPPLRSSPARRPPGQERSDHGRYRQERSGGNSDGSRGPDFKRGGDRTYANGNRSKESNGISVGRSRGAMRNGGDGTRQIEEVLHYIQTEWGFMAQDQCVPVQVALQLMDTSSLGRASQYGQFQDTHQQLQTALKAIVNEHHQGFNSSIGTFHKIQSSIQASQSRLRVLKDSLDQAKVGLSTTRPELRGLASTSQSYDEMLQALSQIEQLRLVTDKLEARISEKRFLTAVDILQDALKMLRKPELDNVGALSDLRVYLANQETSLTDILIEELHSHLYLKSPYCQDRWKAHAKEQSNGTSSQGSTDNTGPAVQPLYQFLDDFDLSIPMVEDPSRNPEADSFYYIQLLVESLNKMDRLGIAVDAIEQRLPVELFRVVDKTNNEVDQRHPTSLRGNTRNSKGKIELDIGENDIRSVVVYDLLWTLYAKFEAIAEGHRVFHDVVSAIARRENVRNSDTLTGSFKELWLLYQNEIRSLLHDYLATDSNMYRMSQSVDPNADIFRRGQRNKDKKMFSLAESDPKSIEMTTELDDLESILKASVPGLVSDTRGVAGATSDDKNQQTDGAATGHKLLIEPSVFNMGLLLPPSLAFLHRLKDIVPPRPDIKTSTLTSFLDDFLVNVFLPQLDETLVKLSTQVFEESDAFQEDQLWTTVARRPIFRGSVAFFNLITAFCRMLDTLPHDQAFSQLIITQMASYYDRCCDWYKSLVSRSEDSSLYGALKASAMFASGPGEIHDTIRNLWTEEEPDPDLLEKEAGLLILHANESPLRMGDIIQDRKTISSLCLLYTSLKWLASKILQLRHITHHDADSSRRNTMRATHNQRWTVLNDVSRAVDGKAPVYLPMTQETVVAFDSVVSSLQELAGTVLLTVHMEIRCEVVQSLCVVLSPHSAPYLLEQVVNDPDPRILTLNADLVAYDEITTRFLRDQEIDFMRSGLGLLIDDLLVTNAGVVGAMNAYGCGRMQLNILVLQQNLKNIEPDVSLARAASYFDLFTSGPEAVVQKAREGKEGAVRRRETFSYDELKTLVELCFSEQIANPERGVSTVAKRGMGEYLLQLSEYMWQT